MPRFTALKPALRKPIPRWKIWVKLSFFGGLVFLFFLGWFWYSGLLTHTQGVLLKHYERLQCLGGLQIKKIALKGRHKMPTDDILKALEITLGDPWSRFDKTKAHAQLSSHPWVKSVHLRQEWPDTLYVHLEERVPLALWQYQNKIILIDKGGEPLTSSIENYLHFPLIIGKGAPKATPHLFHHLRQHPTLQQHVIRATWIGERRWDLTLKNGCVLMLPEENYPQSLKTIEGLQKKHGIFEKAKKTIDMRLPKKMVMR